MNEVTLFGRGRLPVPLTALIGREHELAELLGILERGDSRLVTVLGTGGIGKTRLAIEVAIRATGQFPDGVVFVPLAAIGEPSLVMPTIARALDVPETTGLEPIEAVIAAVGERRLLLVLDNVEQVRPAETEIARLLAACPHVHLLVTSRVRLNVRGARDLPLAPLPLPPEQDEDAAEVAANPAVRLFLERAQERAPTLTLSEHNAHAIAAICRRLDGLPLAIELAAVWTKMLPPAAILSRLDRRLALLTGGPSDLPLRQRTLRNAIAWSFDQLAPGEQALFRRVSVFTGGFTLRAAEAIAADPDPAASAISVLDGLSALVEASLVRSEATGDEPRFVLLETLREFGNDTLEASGEADEFRTRHAEFFLAFAEAAMLRLRGAERTIWLERLEDAHDNLRAALSWLCERGDAARAVRLAGALWQFWWWRSYVVEGRQRLEQVRALPGADAAGVAWARVLTGSGALEETHGAYDAAERFHEFAVEAWTRLGDKQGLAFSLLFRWLVAFNAGDPERMAALSAESLRLYRELDDPWGIAMSLMEQGVMTMLLGENDQAEAFLTDALGRFAAIKDAWGVAICQGALGNVSTNRGRYERAAGLLKTSLTSLVHLNDLWGVGTMLPAAVRMAMEQDRLELMVQLSAAVDELQRSLGTPLKVPFRIRFEQNLAAARSRLGEERFARAYEAGQRLSPSAAIELAFAPRDGEKATDEAANPIAATLSAREREVARLLPGRTAKEIGDILFISDSTVRTHIEHMCNKLGLQTPRELVPYLFKHGFYDGLR